MAACMKGSLEGGDVEEEFEGKESFP